MQRETTQPLYLDLHLEPGTSFEQALPAAHNAFVYVYRGGVNIEGADVPVQRMAILANRGDGVALTAGPDGARALLIAGRPLNEPIVQYGPFVMNSEAEIEQAINDYRATQFGGWPWPDEAPVHRDRGRFARHVDGRVEDVAAV